MDDIERMHDEFTTLIHNCQSCGYGMYENLFQNLAKKDLTKLQKLIDFLKTLSTDEAEDAENNRKIIEYHWALITNQPYQG